MRALIDGDLVIGLVRGTADGQAVPAALVDVEASRLRFDGGAVVDATEYSTFYIDPRGQKHILDLGPGWPSLGCDWDAVLVNDAGTWRIAAAADDIAATKARAKARLAIRAEIERERYITPGDGKAAIYALKRAEAQRWQAAVDVAGSPQLEDYPWIAARAARLGVGGQDVADEWNARAAAWEAAGRAIEDVYEAAAETIDALEEGATDGDAQAIIDSIIWP